MSDMSRGQLDRFENRYQLRQRVTRTVGRAAGEAVMGDKIDRLERTLARVEKNTRNAPERTGRMVGDKVNGASRRGSKRGR